MSQPSAVRLSFSPSRAVATGLTGDGGGEGAVGGEGAEGVVGDLGVESRRAPAHQRQVLLPPPAARYE
jgi:hypothetical protein